MVKKRKKFNYNKDRKRQWKKAKKKANIKCDAIKTAWDNNISLKRNLEEMGLVENPNKAFHIPKTHELMIPQVTSTRDTLDVIMQDARPNKTTVIQALEKEASCRCDPASVDVLSQPECQYLTRLMDKYGDDYKAMARDSRNFYQLTPRQIRRKIVRFMNTPKHYEAYLLSKQCHDKQND